jgi:predicted MFS family arabinose efflux permease
LPFAFDKTIFGLPLFAVFYGLDWVATVPPTVRLAATVFGKERGPLMFAWIAAAHQLGAALIAFAAGVLRVELGSYLEAFMLSGLLCFCAAIMVLFIGRSGRAQQPIPVPALS